MNKKVRIILIAAIVLIVIIVPLAFKNGRVSYKLIKVERGNVVQEVSETGQVSKGEEINLSFKVSGKIEKNYVKIGDYVSPGSWLVGMDANQLNIQLQESRASLDLAKAKLESAKTSLENNQQSISDISKDAQEDLKQARENGLNVLDDAYLKANNAYNFMVLMEYNYFYGSDQESSDFKFCRATIQTEMNKIKNQIDIAKPSSEKEKIEIALSETEKGLDIIYEKLETARNICEKSSYKTSVSSANKTSLDDHKSYILGVRDDIVASQQAIASTKITNQTSINIAQAKISTSQRDIGLYQAEVKKAESQAVLLEAQIQEAVLKSPVYGQVAGVEKMEGETFTAAEVVVKIIPASPFNIKVDIYEEDITKVKISDSVSIKLIAFSNKEIKGRVVSIEPGEKIVNNVVYYETTIGFDEEVSGLKPGMTADIVITTNFKENVLTLLNEAITERDGKNFVNILESNKIKEKEIQVGLEGNNGIVEIVSGLNENEEVVLP